MKLKLLVVTLLILILAIIYSYLTPFSKDVVKTILAIVGTVSMIIVFCYGIILRKIKKRN
ncbi:hypothetical protein IGI65_001945 [Enterococcus sp. DIV0755b]